MKTLVVEILLNLSGLSSIIVVLLKQLVVAVLSLRLPSLPLPKGVLRFSLECPSSFNAAMGTILQRIHNIGAICDTQLERYSLNTGLIMDMPTLHKMAENIDNLGLHRIFINCHISVVTVWESGFHIFIKIVKISKMLKKWFCRQNVKNVDGEKKSFIG